MERINISDLESSYQLVAEALDSDGIVIFPTETCYGALVRADSEEGVSKLLNYKQRPPGKAISIALSSTAQIAQFISNPDKLVGLADKFLPGPITLVGEASGVVDQRLESEKGTLGIRISSYKPLTKFLEYYGRPVTATSANTAGKGNPYSVDALLNTLSAKKQEQIALIVDAGKLPQNPPTAVIDTTSTDKVFREGLFSPRDLELGEVYTTNSEEETIELAAKVLGPLEPKVFLLYGELGAGKTQFAKGIAKGMGVKTQVNSPSFSLVKEYQGDNSLLLYHADLWRLKGEVDIAELGIDPASGVVVIEWPENLLELPAHISVKIMKLDANTRRIVLT